MGRFALIVYFVYEIHRPRRVSITVLRARVAQTAPYNNPEPPLFLWVAWRAAASPHLPYRFVQGPTTGLSTA